MGRLIDADELLKRFRYGEADTDNDKAWISTIRRMIKEQPTAYDVDKVVELIDEALIEFNDGKDWTDDTECVCTECVFKDVCDDGVYESCIETMVAVCKNKVRKGGVE